VGSFWQNVSSSHCGWLGSFWQKRAAGPSLNGSRRIAARNYCALRWARSGAAMLLRLYVPFLEEATHPQCGCEGYPDWPGRASSKEGES